MDERRRRPWEAGCAHLSQLPVLVGNVRRWANAAKPELEPEPEPEPEPKSKSKSKPAGASAMFAAFVKR